jgi:serine/threonine protein phosphatase 1
MTTRHFVIPDIHGCDETFRALLENVIRLQPTDMLYLLGDLIDRGPRSKGVLDSILRLRREGFAVHVLCGNHEEMLLRSRDSMVSFELWMANGGKTTLNSFNVESADEIPYHYRNFLVSLPRYIVLKDFILVHACMNFDIPDPFADPEAMLWTRSCKVKKEQIGGRRLVCGHTPVSRDAVRESMTTDRIMLDNGCVYNGNARLGTLAALELNSMSLYFQENIE